MLLSIDRSWNAFTVELSNKKLTNCGPKFPTSFSRTWKIALKHSVWRPWSRQHKFLDSNLALKWVLLFDYDMARIVSISYGARNLSIISHDHNIQDWDWHCYLQLFKNWSCIKNYRYISNMFLWMIVSIDYQLTLAKWVITTIINPIISSDCPEFRLWEHLS